MKKPTPPEQRFMTKVDKTDTCWLWLGATVRPRTDASVYGLFYSGSSHANPQNTTAHRFAYKTFVGPIPDGYEVDHLCKNTLCVRPDHLEAVPPRVNNLRSNSRSANNARKTHCPNGHAYAEHGYVNPSTGKRRCKTCSNEYSRRYHYGFRGDVTKL